MNTRTSLALLVVMVLVSGFGCVRTEDINGGFIQRYQEAMADRAPQPRVDPYSQDPRNLGLLRPVEGSTGPRLTVAQDKDRTLIYLSLDEAIMRSLANSQDVQVVSFDPEIAREQIIQAEAAFDAIVFASASYDKSQQPSIIPRTSTLSDANDANSARIVTPGRTFFTPTKTTQYQVGIKQQLPSGGAWQIAPTLTRTVTSGTRGQSSIWESALLFDFTQPLLRNAGPQFTLAQVQLARLNYKNSLAQFRQQVETTTNLVITNYWTLIQAKRNLAIQNELLDKTIQTRDRIRERLNLDATLVNLAQAESAVQSRQANVIAAQKAVGDAQDNLVRLLSDAQLNLIANYEVVPTTPLNQVAIKVDTADQMALSLIYSPVLEQARLAISAAEVNVKVAKNQVLPKLDFEATASVGGAAEEAGRSISHSTFDSLGYSFALNFEYPLGDRLARAQLAQQKFQKLRAISTLQNTADQLAIVIKERIRQLDTTFQQIVAQGAAVKAAAEQLRALDETERLRARLTPEFLQTKLQAQETLANAELAEVQAEVNYNTAIADLARFTGTLLRQHGISLEKMPQIERGGNNWPLEQPTSRPVGVIEGPLPTTLPTTSTTTLPTRE